MIEDKKGGIVIAENDDEVSWYNEVETLKQEIKAFKLRIERAEKDLKVPMRKAYMDFINGCKKSIKLFKQAIKVKKEYLKLAERKLSSTPNK